MSNHELIAKTIAENIIYYRKQKKLTQLELAEKLNYSDKSVSKWERAESIPSIFILNDLSLFFGITLNDLVSKKKIKPKKKTFTFAYFYSSISLIVATISYVILRILESSFDAWKVFIYGITISFLVLYVFAIIYKKKVHIAVYFTFFIWLLALSVFISIAINRKYLIFIATIPIYLFILYLNIIINKKRQVID